MNVDPQARLHRLMDITLVLCVLVVGGFYLTLYLRKKREVVTPSMDPGQITVTNTVELHFGYDFIDKDGFSSAQAAMVQMIAARDGTNYYWYTPPVLNLQGATGLRVGTLDGRKLEPGDVLQVGDDGTIRFVPSRTDVWSISIDKNEATIERTK